MIDKLGPLEYIFVTPSHHRVHHAINDEYIDKNYGQILILWDKLFGTFQAELDSVPPVYGTLTQVKTWNPIIINFKYVWQLFKDFWKTKYILDKVKIWFMPTGWRPDDVKLSYPVYKINPKKQKKYDTHCSNSLLYYAWVQLFFSMIFMFHLFTVFHLTDSHLNYLYAIFIFCGIFSYTSLLDGKKYFIFAEFFRLLIGIYIILVHDFNWYNLNGIYFYFILCVISISFFISVYFYKNNNQIIAF